MICGPKAVPQENLEVLEVPQAGVRGSGIGIGIVGLAIASPTYLGCSCQETLAPTEAGPSLLPALASHIFKSHIASSELHRTHFQEACMDQNLPMRHRLKKRTYGPQVVSAN